MANVEISTIKSSQTAISNLLIRESSSEIIAEILEGLLAKQKYISSRFFYDDRGSLLFEKITALPEYYPTRTEQAILMRYASEIVGAGQKRNIIELGSGDCSKISILLETIPNQAVKQMRYFPVDVNEAAILKAAVLLSQKYPDMKIHGLLADFMKHLSEIPGEDERLICFFGSTLGNFSREEATGFVKQLKTRMRPGDTLLLGLDMVKDVTILEAAYNDRQAVTAAFNKNILRVVNRLAKTNFQTGDFEHMAFYNGEQNRIEMHLVALRDLQITTPFLDGSINLREGETIHTENSHKFTYEDIRRFADFSGLSIINVYSDMNNWFSLVQFQHE